MASKPPCSAGRHVALASRPAVVRASTPSPWSELRDVDTGCSVRFNLEGPSRASDGRVFFFFEIRVQDYQRMHSEHTGFVKEDRT